MGKNNINSLDLVGKLANHLVINSSAINNLGLLHGKMGIVVFFYRYGRYIKNRMYEEFAGELLDEIFEDVHNQLPIDFENGYLGIGWGIEYLANEKFIDGNTNIVLEDMDKKIMERDIRRISDMSLETGLEGIFHFVLSRIQNNLDVHSLFDKQYFSDLFNITDGITSGISEPLSTLILDFRRWILTKELNYNSSIFLHDFFQPKIPNNDNIYEWNLSLDGCAGIGLNIIKS